MAAALGLGLQPGDVAISLRTSGTAFAVSSVPIADESGVVAGFADATGRYLPLVCTLNATRVTDTVASWMGVDLSELSALALKALSGSEGVVMVPFFDGERTPNRPEATGEMVRLRTGTTAAQINRAAHEGVICGLLNGVDALASNGSDNSARMILVEAAPGRLRTVRSSQTWRGRRSSSRRPPTPSPPCHACRQPPSSWIPPHATSHHAGSSGPEWLWNPLPMPTARP